MSARNEAKRGAYARQMLIWKEILYSDGMLGMLYNRLIDNVASQSWTIEVANDSPEAEEQRAKLESFYDSISNLSGSFGSLATAIFFGYAHLQLVSDEWGNRFDFVDQTYWVRPGVLNDWQFNPEARMGTNRGESVEEETLVVLEHPFPILFPASQATFERTHAKMIWDNHSDRYGSAPAIITAPPNASRETMDLLAQACEELKSGASVVLPQGAEAKPLDASNINENYFKSRIDMADRDQVRFVMAGTLTVLNESGSGTLAGNAHQDSWNAVVQGVCSKVAEAFNKVICPLVLGNVKPLARLKITFEPVRSPLEKAQEQKTLHDAGIQPEREEIEAKLGTTLEQTPPVSLNNRAPKPNEPNIPEDAFNELQQLIEDAMLNELFTLSNDKR